MNTIKITLDKNASGKVAELYKDFAMYVNSYQNKLVDVYVPKEMLYTNTQNLKASETPTQFANSVKIGGILTADDGSKVTTDSYYLDYLKETTINNVDYVVFERILPKELTVYAGNQQIVINVLSVDGGVTPPKVLQVVTTQICNLLVQNSDYIGDETVVDPTKTEEFDARITQNRTDIVDLQTRMTTAESNIDQNTKDIAQNTNDIAEIKQVIGTGEDYIGTLEWESATLPTDAELNAFVYEKRQREQKSGDVIIVIQKLEGQTDKNFKYIYALTGWTSYEIPPMELAGNGTAGIVSGTYGIGKTNDTLVDIAGGEILNIYIKDTAGQYRNLVEYLNTSNTTIANIINGTTQVGNALKAVNDSVGNNIFETYLTKALGVTKTELRDYAMPREFNDVDFISSQGYQDNVPTTPESGIQFTAISATAGDTQLFNIVKTNTADFELSAKNGYSNTIYVSADKDCQVQFRLTTQYKKASGDWENLNIELTSSISLTAGNIEKLTFASPFTYLEENVISLTNGDQIRQILEVVTTTIETITFDVYSSQTYPSIFNLTSQSYTLSEMTENIGKELTLGADGIVESNRVVFTVKDAESFIEYRTSYRKFLMNLHLPVSGAVNLTFPVAITFGDTTFYVYNLMKGSVTPITFGDLLSTKNYSDESGYFFNLEMLFLQTEDFVGFFIIPPAINAKQLDNIIDDTDTVVTDLDESGTKLVIHLSAETVNKLAKVLVIPTSAPPATELVAISPQNVQQLIELGGGLELVNGHLNVVLDSDIAPFVDYSKAQNLTDAQKAQARANIGAGSVVVSVESVNGKTGAVVLDANDVGAVATDDIVDNLTTEDATKVLSANQGKVLSDMNAATNQQLVLAKSAITAMQGDISTLQNSVSENTEDITQNMADIASNTSEINGLKTSLSTTNANVSQNANNIANNASDIDDIEAKIPTQASSTNQLADKDFVNSSINNIAAFYITRNASGDAFETYAQLSTATVFYSGGEPRTPTRNDYCIVRTDENHNNATTRYIYQGSQWEFQYIVSDAPLTAEQLAAINSGITSALVTKLNGIATGANKTTVVQAKGTSTSSVMSQNATTTELNKAFTEIEESASAGNLEISATFKKADGTDYGSIITGANKANIDGSNLTTANVTSLLSKLGLKPFYDWVKLDASVILSSGTASATMDLASYLPSTSGDEEYEIYIQVRLENKSGSTGVDSNIKIYSDKLGSSSDSIIATQASSQVSNITYRSCNCLTIPVHRYLYSIPQAIDFAQIKLFGYRRIK